MDVKIRGYLHHCREGEVKEKTLFITHKKEKQTSALAPSVFHGHTYSSNRPNLPVVKVLQEHVTFLGLLTPVTDNAARAVDHLASIALTIERTFDFLLSAMMVQGKGREGSSTKSSPLSELLAISNLYERDLVLGAERLDELLVGFLVAALVEHAHVRLAAVERLGRFAETTREAVVDKGMAENALQRVFNRHLALGCGIGGHFNLLNRLNLRDLRVLRVRRRGGGIEGWTYFLSCVRLFKLCKYPSMVTQRQKKFIFIIVLGSESSP